MPGIVPVVSTPTTAGAYLEYAPPASLAPFVECFWSRGESAASSIPGRSHRVLPDGCVDIILAFDAAGASEGAHGGVMTGALAVGAMTRPVVFSDSATTSYLAVRFRPGVAGVIFGRPASELTDEGAPLDDVWTESAFGETLTDLADTSARIRALSAAIARRLIAAPAAPPTIVTVAIDRIAAARGNLSIGVLASDLGVTRQHLARAFSQHVGLSPKLFARIVRMRSVVALARRRTDVDWSSVALDAGYYDQSHLIAELKELTGLPPRGWLLARA